ncbi:MAG: type III-A CRISPR-associated protein Cas10/Csm1 [Bacteroidia bacterium]|nr:type III-A CRISPR-associated protein Cas10/Csm1 [Bacteroidia bacterium]
MNQERYKVYMAALLHDIGKFYQRSDVSLSQLPWKVDAEKIAGLICPKNEYGSFGYQHVIWTARFFEEQKDIFNSVEESGKSVFHVNPFTHEKGSDTLETLAIYHHYPDTELQSLIQLADCWSSGIDRSNSESFELENKDKENDYYKKVPLRPLFQTLKTPLNNSNPDETEYGYSFSALALNDSIFPSKVLKFDSKEPEYKKLWECFCDELKLIPVKGLKNFTETLQALLKKYTFYIPSSTQDMRNVSLFEHLKTTAAIADCLYAYRAENPESFEYATHKRVRLSVKDNHYPLLMCCGDISGIQKFIYDIASQKAASSLKGRSFYLQLLIDSIIEYLCEKTGVTSGHVIYSSGGKFYMLLPNTQKVREALEDAENQIIQNLYKELGTTLYLCLGYVPFSMNDKFEILVNGERAENNKVALGELWKKVSEETSAKKQQKFKNLMLNEFEGFFGEKGSGKEVYPIGEEHITCSVTGEILPKKQAKCLDEKEKDEEKKVWVKKIIKQQADLGKELKDTKYLAISKESKYLNRKSELSIQPGNLGYEIHLFDSGAISSINHAKIMKLNETGFTQNINGNDVAYGFLFYGGNEQAMIKSKEDNRPKTFEELVMIEGQKNQGFKRLGVLRMDVDNLGKIFKDGFSNGETKPSFAAYATLSSQLDLFFSGYLNIIRNQDKYKDYVNILYSGGDDVFAVGRWDLLIEFAEEIRAKFREFVCNREDISISAGIALIGEKFPISKGAVLAGEAEEEAKNFNGKSKNAICLFGEVISWEKEWDFVIARKRDLSQWLSEGKITKSVLNRIMQFKLLKDEPVKKAKLEGKEAKESFEWIWVAAYFFAKRSTKENKEANETLRTFHITGKWKELDSLGAYRGLDLLAVAARWVELEERAKDKEAEPKTEKA